MRKALNNDNIHVKLFIAENCPIHPVITIHDRNTKELIFLNEEEARFVHLALGELLLYTSGSNPPPDQL
jgi:hypothetical protein